LRGGQPEKKKEKVEIEGYKKEQNKEGEEDSLSEVRSTGKKEG